MRTSYDPGSGICQIIPSWNAGGAPALESARIGERMMDGESEAEMADGDEIALVPAASVGFMLYPWAVQLILANPPANDAAATPPAAR